MRILQVNKFWYARGGADVYALHLSRELEARGHEVARFGMQHPKNEDSPWNEYFADQVELRGARSFSTALKVIHNRNAAEQLQKLIDEFKPEVIHLHNFYHQLSSSILPVCRASGARVVMTMHDYKRISPNYELVADGEIYTGYKQHQYYKMLWKRREEDGFINGVLLAKEAYFTWLTGRYRRCIDHLIAPSAFMKEITEEWGVRTPITHLTNMIDMEPAKQPAQKKDYVLYVGRLAHSKGVQTLLRAAESLPEQQFMIIGDGPAKPEEWPANVDYRGHQDREAVRKAMAEAQALIVPSEWYEVNSLVIPEAHALGTWTIVAQTGSIDLVEDGVNGWWFEMGNALALVSAIERLSTEPHEVQPFLHITPEEHINRLVDIYSNS